MKKPKSFANMQVKDINNYNNRFKNGIYGIIIINQTIFCSFDKNDRKIQENELSIDLNNKLGIRISKFKN